MTTARDIPIGGLFVFDNTLFARAYGEILGEYIWVIKIAERDESGQMIENLCLLTLQRFTHLDAEITLL